MGLIVTVGLILGAIFRTVQLVICRPVLPVSDPWVLITLPLPLNVVLRGARLENPQGIWLQLAVLGYGA